MAYDVRQRASVMSKWRTTTLLNCQNSNNNNLVTFKALTCEKYAYHAQCFTRKTKTLVFQGLCASRKQNGGKAVSYCQKVQLGYVVG